MDGRILQLWKIYRSTVIPAGTDPKDVERLRLCFYGGAVSMFEIMTKLGDAPEGAGAAGLRELVNELTDHVEECEQKAKGRQ